MRNPLGYWNYYIGNKKEMAKYILCLVFCILILGVTKMVLVSQQREIIFEDNDSFYFSRICLTKWSHESEQLLEQVEALDEVEAVYPCEFSMNSCNMLFAIVDECAYFMDEEGIKLLLGRLDPKFDLLSLPKQDSGGMVAPSKLVKSQGYRIGDSVCKDRYTYLAAVYDGIFYSEFIPYSVKTGGLYYIVIPKVGQEAKMNEQVKAILDSRADIWDMNRLKRCTEYIFVQVSENFNMIMMVITLMTSITAGVLTYFHYQGRRDEIKMLSALGFSKQWIIGRMTKEIMITTLIAALIAMLFIVFLCSGFNELINRPNGYELFRFDGGIFILITSIASFMMTFSIVPTWIMLSQEQK